MAGSGSSPRPSSTWQPAAPDAGAVRRLDHRGRPELGRLAVALHQAIEDAGRSGTAEVLTLPRFYWAFRPDSPPHSRRRGIGRPSAAASAASAPGRPSVSSGPEGTEAGVSAPPAAVPEAIYADVGYLRGRVVRNPAFAALRRAGLIPARLEYSRVARLDGPRPPPTRRARRGRELRARIEDRRRVLGLGRVGASCPPSAPAARPRVSPSRPTPRRRSGSSRASS